MGEQDQEVAAIQDGWTNENRSKRRWLIVEESDGYTLHLHTFDGVAPPSHYPDKRAVASRLLQLLHIGPVAPQTWPESVCIELATDEAALTRPAALPKELNADGATPDQVERASAAVAANLEDGAPKHGSAQGYACALTAIMQTDAALPKGEDIDQLVQDARVAACGTRLTCREREVIRALCDAVVARAALPKEGGEAQPVFAFLLGEGPLEGLWFGDRPVVGGAFWWRRFLRSALSSLPVRSGEVEQ